MKEFILNSNKLCYVTPSTKVHGLDLEDSVLVAGSPGQQFKRSVVIGQNALGSEFTTSVNSSGGYTGSFNYTDGGADDWYN